MDGTEVSERSSDSQVAADQSGSLLGELEIKYRELERQFLQEKERSDAHVLVLRSNHSQEVDSKDEEIESLKKQIESMKTKHESVSAFYKEKISTHNAKVKQTELHVNTKFRDMTAKLQESKKTIEQLTVDNRSLGRACADIREQLMDEKNVLIETKLQLLDKTAELGSALLEVQQLSERVSEAESMVHVKEQECKELEVSYLEKINQLEKDLSDVQSRNRQLASKLELEKQEKNVANIAISKIQALLEDDLKMTQQQTASLQKQVKELQQENETLKKDAEEKGSKASPIMQAQPQVDSPVKKGYESQIESLQEQLQIVGKSLSSMQNELSQTQSRVEKEIPELTSKSQKLASENEQYKIQVDTLKTEIADLNSKLAELTGLETKLKGALRLSTEEKALKDMQDEVHKKRISTLEEDVKNLNTSLENQRVAFELEKTKITEASSTLRAQVDELTNQNAKFKQLIDDANKQIAILQEKSKETDTLRQEKESLENELSKINEQHTGLQSKYAQLSQKYGLDASAFELERTQLNQKLDDALKKKKEFQLAAAEARQKLEESIKASDIDKVESAQLISTLESMIVQIRKELKDTENDNIKLLSELEEAESKLLEVRQDFFFSVQKGKHPSDKKLSDLIPNPERFLEVNEYGSAEPKDRQPQNIVYPEYVKDSQNSSVFAVQSRFQPQQSPAKVRQIGTVQQAADTQTHSPLRNDVTAFTVTTGSYPTARRVMPDEKYIPPSTMASNNEPRSDFILPPQIVSIHTRTLTLPNHTTAPDTMKTSTPIPTTITNTHTTQHMAYATPRQTINTTVDFPPQPNTVRVYRASTSSTQAITHAPNHSSTLTSNASISSHGSSASSSSAQQPYQQIHQTRAQPHTQTHTLTHQSPFAPRQVTVTNIPMQYATMPQSHSQSHSRQYQSRQSAPIPVQAAFPYAGALRLAK